MWAQTARGSVLTCATASGAPRTEDGLARMMAQHASCSHSPQVHAVAGNRGATRRGARGFWLREARTRPLWARAVLRILIDWCRRWRTSPLPARRIRRSRSVQQVWPGLCASVAHCSIEPAMVRVSPFLNFGNIKLGCTYVQTIKLHLSKQGTCSR